MSVKQFFLIHYFNQYTLIESKLAMISKSGCSVYHADDKLRWTIRENVIGCNNTQSNTNDLIPPSFNFTLKIKIQIILYH